MKSFLVIWCTVLAISVPIATGCSADTLLPQALVEHPERYANLVVSVTGKVKTVEPVQDLVYKRAYALEWKGFEIRVFTKQTDIEPDQLRTVTGKWKYNGEDKKFDLYEVRTIPPWMFAVGGGLLAVLIIVLVMIFRQGKAPVTETIPVPDFDQGSSVIAPFGVCPECNKPLLATGKCPECSPEKGSQEAPPVPPTPATVDIRMPKAVLIMKNGPGKPFDVGIGHTTIGRAPNNAVVIADGTVSSEHAEIIEKGGKFYVQDRDSTNGTFVNDARVDGRVLLNDGDRVKFGNVELKFIEVVSGE